MHDDQAARLRSWVEEDFDIRLTAIDRVDGSNDVAAEVWRGESFEGTPYAVKHSGGGSKAGLLLPSCLEEHGVPGIVAPVPTRAGRLWSERAGKRLSLVPWAAGDSAIDGGMTPRHWTSFGELLARAHALTEVEATFLPREGHTHERWASEVRELDDRFRGAVDNDQLTPSLVAEWRGAEDLIAALLEQADDLGSDLRKQHVPRVVCHGDAHLGNVLLRDDNRVWLIDWDDAVLAPPERDLMFVLGGVLYFALIGPQEQEWFFDGYGQVDIDPTRLAYYQSVRAMEDFAVPAAQVLDPEQPEQERAEALEVCRGVFSSTGLAKLALTGRAGWERR